MNEMDVKVIIGIADNDMNLSQAACKMFCHRNTILYHVKRIQTATGLNPLNFYDLCKLVQMVKEERRNDGE